jgi:hypothetical protein
MKRDATWAALRKPGGMLDGDEVMRGRLTRSQTLIVSESMPSTQLIPTIRSLVVGGWVGFLQQI